MRIHGRAALPGYERDVLAERPPIDAAMAMVLEAWRSLETERPLGYGCVGYIPESKVREWARWERLDRELTEMLIAVIRKLDAARMERDAAERAQKQGGKR